MSNVPAFLRIGKKRTVGEAFQVIDDRAKVRNFVRADTGPLSVTSAQRLFAEWCVKVDGSGGKVYGFDQDQSDSIPERFRSHFATVVALQMYIFEAVPWPLGDVFLRR